MSSRTPYAGKEFGPMNMDELMKSIWSAEENQNQATTTDGVDRSVPWNNLQRQGSLMLPRTISTKTVDEVFRDLIKDSGVAKDVNVPERQPTLGEITLEEFLVRAGVVREDTQPVVRSDNGGFYGDLIGQNNNNNGLAIEFQQQSRNIGLLSNGTAIPNKVPDLALNVRGVGSQYQQQPLFPKQTNLAFASPVKNLVQASGLQSNGIGMVGLRAKGYLREGRGRKPSGAVEKVFERRQRRMIKNKESASRSRARKQAYTLELEAEVAKPKERIAEKTGRNNGNAKKLASGENESSMGKQAAILEQNIDGFMVECDDLDCSDKYRTLVHSLGLLAIVIV